MKRHGQAEDLARAAALSEEDKKKLEAAYRAAGRELSFPLSPPKAGRGPG